MSVLSMGKFADVSVRCAEAFIAGKTALSLLS